MLDVGLLQFSDLKMLKFASEFCNFAAGERDACSGPNIKVMVKVSYDKKLTFILGHFTNMFKFKIYIILWNNWRWSKKY